MIYTRKQKIKDGYESEVTVYECEEYKGFPYKEQCTKARGNKKFYVSKEFIKDDRNQMKTSQAKQEFYIEGKTGDTFTKFWI